MTDTAALPPPRGISPSMLLFAVVYGGLVVVAGVLGVKIVAVGPLTVEAGIFAFLQLVVLSSAVNELHGPAAANRLVRFGFIPLILSALLIQLVIALPAAGFWDKQAEYELILAQGSRLMAAGLISYGISQTLNVYIFDRCAAAPARGNCSNWCWTINRRSGIRSSPLPCPLPKNLRS
ncbi:MAG: queuosine precursor transporter [Nitrospira sp.]|nr:queuosine precursor transporter [Nitrospira sp.]